MKCRRKPKGITARLRAAKSRKRKTGELTAMQQARRRDGYCRFPLCGCRRPRQWFGPATDAEVSHQQHRGMGGNPKGDRTVTGLLLLVCNWRHKIGKFSIDKKTLRWVPLTDAGADGPIRWLIRADAIFIPQGFAPLELTDGTPLGIDAPGRMSDQAWYELAREIAPHEYEPITEAQAVVLGYLASMSQ